MATFVYDGDGRRVKSTINNATTYFVGAHYEVTDGGTVIKYYYAGAQRIAMRQNGTLNYILGDHLGSTSLVTDANGNIVSETRYKAWGEVRYSSGTTPTKYQFTGQYSYASDFGLLFYNARMYDPALGRFAQADSIVPGGVQGWDRYAYANNNPVLYNDPSGHCGVLCGGIVIVATVSVVALVFAAPFVVSAFGYGSDTIGVATTMAFTDTNNAVVAAGLAVQSQYPWAIVGGSGKGLAQLTSTEMEGEDPYSSSVAVAGMEKRIQNAVDDCTSCTTGYDRLLVAAMAQNGSVGGLDNFGDLPLDPETNAIDWETLFDNPKIGNSGSSLAQLRAGVRDAQYSTLFMVRLYIQDLRVLMKLGYQLPDGITEDDVKYIEDHFLNHNKDNRR